MPDVPMSADVSPRVQARRRAWPGRRRGPLASRTRGDALPFMAGMLPAVLIGLMLWVGGFGAGTAPAAAQEHGAGTGIGAAPASSASESAAGEPAVDEPAAGEPGADLPDPAADPVPPTSPGLASGTGGSAALGETAAVPPDERRFGLFGSREFPGTSLAALPRWTDLLARIDAERSRIAACDAHVAECPSPRVVAWRAALRALEGRHPLAQLGAVNRFVNALMARHGTAAEAGLNREWPTPLQFLHHGGGCLGAAITKFESLLELGFGNDQMRIAIVDDTLRHALTAVLAVNQDGRTLILDCQLDIVVGHESLMQYLPQYSLNLTHRWAHVVTPELLRQFHAAQPPQPRQD